MTDMISISRASLETIYKTIGAHLGAEVAAALSKNIKVAKAAKAGKKPRSNTGQGTAWSAFSSKIQRDHKEEVDAVKAEAAAKRKAAKEAGEPVPEETQGPHLHWCSRYKEAHEAEWLAFKATWEAEHPKGSRSSAGSEAASVADDASTGGSDAAAAPKKKRGIKKDSECTPEELAARKAKRAATKAAKSGAAVPDAEPASVEDAAEEEEAVALPEEVESVETEDSLIDWTSPKGKVYLRVGHLDAEGDGIWNEGNWLWAKNADGSKGAYAGILLASGKIDSSPATLADEPEIE